MAIPVTFEQVTHNSPDGAQMGNATDSLNGFYGATPVVQPTSGDQAVSVATGAAVAVTAVAVTQTAASVTNQDALALGFTWTANDPGVTDGTATIDDGTTVGDDNDAGAPLSAIEVEFNTLRTDVIATNVTADAAVVDLAAYKAEIDKLVLDVASQKVEFDKVITDVALLITLSNQIRSELVTLGLIKGS